METSENSKKDKETKKNVSNETIDLTKIYGDSYKLKGNLTPEEAAKTIKQILHGNL